MCLFRYLKSTLGNIRLIKQFMTDEGTTSSNSTDKEVGCYSVILGTSCIFVLGKVSNNNLFINLCSSSCFGWSSSLRPYLVALKLVVLVFL